MSPNSDIKYTPISSIGEFGLIDLFRDTAVKYSNSQVEHSIGDDAAIIKPSEGRRTVVTTDIQIQGIHFDLSYTSMKHLGHKCAAANLSDIAAMSALPIAAFISLGIHSNVSLEMIQDLFGAMTDEFGRFGCVIAGGDTSGSPVGLVVNITLIGEVEPEREVLRGGAKSGDVICVTGDLGRSHAGLKILQREKNRFVQTGQSAEFSADFSGYDDALMKHLLPEARVTLSRSITEKMKVHSMIDISDGLVSDLLHICKSSGVCATVEEGLIPIDPITRRIADESDEKALDYALIGGEDYEILFTISESDFPKLYSIDGNIRAIGRIEKGDPGVRVARTDGSAQEFDKYPSYQHFSKPRGV